MHAPLPAPLPGPLPGPVRIAVTGASGFIGRHVLAELLRHDGLQVVATTRDTRKLQGLDARITACALDIAAPPPDPWAHLQHPDVLLHLAWDGLPNYHAPHHLDTELPRQQRFLQAMVDGGLPAMVVAGTCFEYGLQSGALDESRPAQPVTTYGRAKVELHRHLLALQGRRPFALAWARLFYTYGPGQSANALYPQLAAAVARGDTAFPMSGGTQQRDYLPVQELARLLVRLALLRRNTGCVNVCAGTPTTVRALVAQWLHDHQWRIALQLGAYPYPEHEPMAFWGVRERLDTLLEQHA